MADTKARSLRALDALNFCNAGIQTGLGPFISIYYSSVRHWDPGQVGVLLACQSFIGILTQTFVGNFVDESQHKRMLTAVAAIAVSAGAAGISLFPQYWAQIIVQLVIGLGVTVFPAATSGFALGLVPEDKIALRMARNETFTHSGNVTFAVMAGVIGTFLAMAGIFYAAAVFAAGMAGAVVFIHNEDVNNEAARAGNVSEDNKEKQPQRRSWTDLAKDRNIQTFAAAVVLFYMANAATLPLVGQLFAKDGKGENASWETALAVFTAEIVMVGVAAFSGSKADSWGRKPLFLIAFAFLAARNALSVVSHNSWYLISLQTLDGVAAALYGLLLKLVTSDLARGSGRFNLLQGAVQSSMGLGGFLSNLGFGFVARALGFNAAFLGLSGVAVAGGLLYQFRMPETKPGKGEEGEKKEA